MQVGYAEHGGFTYEYVFGVEMWMDGSSLRRMGMGHVNGMMGRARTAVLQRHGTESVAWSGNVRREGMKWGGGQSMVVAEVAGWGIGAWEDGP